jgi:hypoxanthine phosphoribosyltransferase
MPGEEKIVPLYSAAQVRQRLDDLARCVNAEYEGRPLVLLGILNGARTVTGELAARLRIEFMVDYVKAASYGDATRPNGRVKVDLHTRAPISGRHVLLVDDIVDTGHTLATVLEGLRREGPKALRTFVLANKPLRRAVHAPLDYVGFTVPEKFIVGCGMGRGDEFRDRPFLGYLIE